jgi:hypothetical protein
LTPDEYMGNGAVRNRATHYIVESIADRARSILGLSVDSRSATTTFWLFFSTPEDAWDPPFDERWSAAQGDHDAQRLVAIDYLEYIANVAEGAPRTPRTD